MKILGLNIGIHDQGVTYIEDGKILFSLEEEKARGVKSIDIMWEYPKDSLQSLFERYDLSYESFDMIATPLHIVQEHLWSKMNIWTVEKCFSVSHHKAHAMGAYFTSGFDGKVLTITSDGAGTTSRSKIYLCEDGRYEEVHSLLIRTSGSLANLWGDITNILGWRGLKDEGKVVGLAAHGKLDGNILNQLKDCVDYLGNFEFGHPGGKEKIEYIMRNYEQLLKYSSEFRANLAYTLQHHTNQIFLSYLEDVRQKYPEYRKLCLAGGLFANVKLNQAINESGLFDEIFIHPAMGDSGLAMGAAIIKANEVGDITAPFKLQDVYFGPSYKRNVWDEELLKYDFHTAPFAPGIIARKIHEGKVVGTFFGKTEYGPRALGNRSILVRPTDKEAHENLNKKLGRDEVMPFAPVVLERAAKEIFGIEKSAYAAEFMTLCYNCSDEWLDRLPAVVQSLDKSARPQVLRPDVNPHYERILEYYEKISGIPVLLNTSFNAHGEPINNHPAQVLRHLENGMVDMIVTEELMISKNPADLLPTTTKTITMKHEDKEIVTMLTEMGLHGINEEGGPEGGTDKGTGHKYTETYARLLTKYKDKEINFLEIGVWQGGSAALWCNYLQKANFVFIDTVNIISPNADQYIDRSRANFLFTDAYTYRTAADVYEIFPEGIDFAIDDGPHTFESMCNFLKIYGPMMKKGGTMVIEDLQSSSWFAELENYIPQGATTEYFDVSQETGRSDDILLIVYT